MYYFIHLAIPAIVVIVMANGVTEHIEWTPLWFMGTVKDIVSSYMSFAVPYFVWTVISACFKLSKRTTVGGFVGLHLLLMFVCLIGELYNAPEVAFLYYFGSPIMVTVSFLVGKYTLTHKSA